MCPSPLPLCHTHINVAILALSIADREHWQLVKKQFSSAGTKSRVLNALALLVESGSIYCALVVIVFLALSPDSQIR